jgi:opacity protein-like surface antigen
VNSAVTSIELMLRRPFGVSSAFPHGRVQPYMTIAPALLFNDDNPGITVGVKAGAGLAWQVHKHIALLAEYRFTHFRFKTTNATVRVEGTVIQHPDIETDLDTHFLLAGISIRL